MKALQLFVGKKINLELLQSVSGKIAELRIGILTRYLSNCFWMSIFTMMAVVSSDEKQDFALSS